MEREGKPETESPTGLDRKQVEQIQLIAETIQAQRVKGIKRMDFKEVKA